MSINQKNVFGDNVVHVVQSRELTPEMQKEVLAFIHNCGAKSAVIRYENGGETQEFSEFVGNFLVRNNINAIPRPVTQSEMRRNEFSIQQNPSDPDYVIIKIGPIQ